LDFRVSNYALAPFFKGYLTIFWNLFQLHRCLNRKYKNDNGEIDPLSEQLNSSSSFNEILFINQHQLEYLVKNSVGAVLTKSVNFEI